jgi:branched-chain amino acid transport system substrate-binding protein
VFAETDRYEIGQLANVCNAGVKIDNRVHPVQMIEKDSQSTPNRAGEVASDSI